jgi:putative addiction module component (TIGR02574 family)
MRHALTVQWTCENLLPTAKALTEVTRDAAELAPSERLKLARILLNLSETESESSDEVQTAWDAEIERRLKELWSGKVKGVPLENVTKRGE